MVVPYFKFSLSDMENLGIREIFIGPTPNMELSKNLLELLLAKNRIRAAVEASEIPFRDW